VVPLSWLPPSPLPVLVLGVVIGPRAGGTVV
jgi:hypothetical protein